ncbi:MAG: glutaredoxin family protein [Anaerolineales bacterium]
MNMPLNHKADSGDRKADVVLYCTPWCSGCSRARAFLRQHHVEYLEVDIEKDREAAARVRGWANGNETTPTFDIRGEIVVDWRPERVAELLGIE